jgi:anti-anti-sigma factor
LQSGTFTISIRKKGAVSVLDVAGRLTSFEVNALRDAISQLLKEGRKNIVLNLEALGYLGSSGIGELARSYVSVVKKRRWDERGWFVGEVGRGSEDYATIQGFP